MIELRMAGNFDQELGRIASGLGKMRPLMADLGKTLEKEVRGHFRRRDAEPNKRGWPKQNFWQKEGAQNTALTEFDETSAKVVVASAAIAAAWLLRRGVHAFCPITHSHPIATYGGLSLTNHGIWLPADRPMMDAARGIVVCQMPTWDQSFGIQHEIDVFQAALKPVEYLPWPLT